MPDYHCIVWEVAVVVDGGTCTAIIFYENEDVNVLFDSTKLVHL
jgi:hypothetical protein